jgi:hypothetical protein
MGSVEDDKVIAELMAEAGAALADEASAERHRERVRELLPEARKLGHGPADLERMIGSLYVARTISRWTADEAAPRRPGRRKPPGAAPRS